MADSIKIGNLDISSFKVGGADCSIYLGSVKLYPTEPPTPHDYSQDYFTIVSEEDNNTISLKNTGYSTSTGATSYWYSVTISASTDGGSTWSKFTTSRGGTATFGTINKGDKILLKSFATKFSNTSSAYHYFDSTKNISAEGNILSLLYGDNFLSYDSLPSISRKEKNRTQQLGCIFKNRTKIISAENLVLKPTTLSPRCYAGMFQGCTSLTTAPSVLSATTLADYCYQGMFNSCTSLTAAPTSIGTSTTNAEHCCYDMFYGCTSLTTAPELPATTLASSCYSNMFQGCTSLTTAPELPVTTLAFSCYSFMFNGCTSLTTAPELPASTLVGSCYNRMFYGCTSLSSITCYATNISADDCVTSWVDGVASSGTFKKPSNMSSWTTGTSGIPNGWTVEDIQTHQWVSYSEGDTVPASLIYGVKLYLDLGADNEIDFQDAMQGGGICFMYVADGDGWYGIDANTSNEIDLSSYYDSTEGCYIVLFSDLGYGGFPIIYPSSEFEFDVQLYI